MNSQTKTPPVPVPRQRKNTTPTIKPVLPRKPEADEPLQFIEFIPSGNDGNTTIKLVDKTVETLITKCENRPMSIICICGPSRKGKSFILGYMLRYLEAMERDESDWMDWTNSQKPLKGFKFRNGTNPETQGIWIWSRPFFIERDDGTKIAVLLMDTQGTYDAFTTTKDMSAIVGLSLLTSSVMIFNCFTDLQENILASLNSYTSYGQLAIDKITGPPFQNLIFLIRDWNNPGEYAYGKRGGKKYLSNVLKVLPHHAPEAKETRENIKSCFSETDCFLMPHIGETALLPTFKGSLDELSKEFARRLEEFINHLINVDTLATKRILGNDITATELKQYLDIYVEVFNSTDIPSPMDMWEATTDAHNNGTIEKAMAAFGNKSVSKLGTTVYFSQAEIQEAVEEIEEETLKIFEELKKIGNKTQISNCQEKFTTKLLLKKEQLQNQLEEARINYVDEVIREAKSKFGKLLIGRTNFRNGVETNFYEEAEIEIMFQETKEYIWQDIQNKLEKENEKSKDQIHGTFKVYTEEELEKVLKTNNDQKNTADEILKVEVKRLVKQFKKELQETTNEQQFAPIDVLKDAQMQIKQSIEKQFVESKKPGSAFFQKAHFKILQTKLETVFKNVDDQHKKNLEQFNKNALYNVRTTVKHFIDELKARAVNTTNKDEFKVIADNLLDEVLAEFDESGNPYPKENALNKETTDLLEKELADAFNVAQTDKNHQLDLERQNLHQKYLAFLEQALELYDNSMSNMIGSGNYVSDEELQNQHENAKLIAWKGFRDLADGSNDTDSTNFKSIFDGKIQLRFESFMATNQASAKLIQTNIKLLLQTSHTDYESLMKDIFEEMKTNEDLKRQHILAKTQIIKQFRGQCPPNYDSSLFQNEMEKLENNIEESFQEFLELFDLQEEKFVANLKGSLSDCRKFYHEEMEKHTTNTRYIQPEELNKCHQQTIKSVISRCSALATLSSNQTESLLKEMDILFETYKEKNDMILNANEDSIPAIGIDLGTTNCCVAVYYQGEVKVIENFSYHNKITTASFVQLDQTGPKSIGDFAKDNAYKDPENTIFDVKRIIGRKFEDSVLQQDMKIWPFTVDKVDGIPQIRVHDKFYYPEQISAALLFELTRMVERYLKLEKGTITKAVITVPAYFTDGQRNATIDAGQIAGLEVLTIISEPTAAAIAYSLGKSHHKGRRILVFDMGGGTFDVSIVDVTPGNIKVLAVDGDTHLGGEDFDNRLVQHCVREFNTKHQIDLLAGRNGPNKSDVLRRLSRLKHECEKAKIMLTSGIQATIFLDTIYTTSDGKVLNIDETVSRATFERLNEFDFRQAIDITFETIKAAGLRKEQIDDIVLVGGSTRIPRIQEMLSDFFNKKALTYSINPDTAVAYGAAIRAAKMNGDLMKGELSATISDVIPYSLGTDVLKGGKLLVSIIIKKNTMIPCKYVEEYSTAYDNQQQMSIQILQGENPVAKNNELLGEFTLDGIPPAKKGKETATVTMEIDTMGCLHVTAFCVSTEGTKSMTITQRKLRMTAEEKQKLIKEFQASLAA